MITYTKIEFLDNGPDKEGKRAYILDWVDPNGFKTKHAQVFKSLFWKADLLLVQEHGGTVVRE